ncbi:CorA family divalent cation transporter [Haloferula sp.]|uniref:CorA family divalent cation transporter n=1 Tax=Haloferula sp. TaxID=2497595 RepID=UPI00329C478A
MSANAEKGYLPPGFDLEPELLDQLSAGPGCQRCLVGHDELLLIVHDLPQTGVPERESLIFWRTPGGGWFGPNGAKQFGLLSDLLDRYQTQIDEYEAMIDEPNGAAVVFKVARHARPLARSTRNLQRALEQTLQHDEDNPQLRSLRDRGHELERAAELLYHDAKLALDLRQAEGVESQTAAVERLNTSVFRLSLLAGFSLPLVGLSGLLGMNVDIPEALKPLFWGILMLGTVMGIAVLLLISRRMGVGK